MLFSCTPEKQGFLVYQYKHLKKKENTINFCNVDSCLFGFFKAQFFWFSSWDLLCNALYAVFLIPREQYVVL